MKKIFITIIAIAICGTSFAQFSQGNFLIGGKTNLSAGFTTTKFKSGGTTTTDSKTTSFSLQPQVGYFAIDNLAVGAGLNISTSTEKDDGSSDKDSFTEFTLTPFARYYFDKFYAQGSIGFGSAKSKRTSGATSTETKFTVGGWSLLGGYTFFLTDAISLEPQIGYASSSLKVKSSDAKSIDSGIVIGIGVYGYISR